MIYINEDTKLLYIPKFFGSSKGSKFELHLTNQTTKEEYAFDVYDEDDNISYYKFNVTKLEPSKCSTTYDMKAIQTGQYDYEISDELSVLSTGILQVGSFNYTSSQTKYQTQKEIKTYESE